jgi:hypothetical protein
MIGEWGMHNIYSTLFLFVVQLGSAVKFVFATTTKYGIMPLEQPEISVRSLHEEICSTGIAGCGSQNSTPTPCIDRSAASPSPANNDYYVGRTSVDSPYHVSFCVP